MKDLVAQELDFRRRSNLIFLALAIAIVVIILSLALTV